MSKEQFYPVFFVAWYKQQIQNYVYRHVAYWAVVLDYIVTNSVFVYALCCVY